MSYYIVRTHINVTKKRHKTDKGKNKKKARDTSANSQEENCNNSAENDAWMECMSKTFGQMAALGTQFLDVH